MEMVALDMPLIVVDKAIAVQVEPSLSRGEVKIPKQEHETDVHWN
ncbi:MAG TPA: hypothetical protein VKV40_04295 [Ktedonobacteraceae bacterium]|nr:hypothetical protein [Ktedonobacteraceae bacterium]